MLNYKATPVQEIHDKVLEDADIRLLVKREDLNHPHISGNKWWKLKYNIEEASRKKKKTILTFGGAYSNHLYATAAAAKSAGFKSIGIVRGEETLPYNPTLAFAASCGMQLHFISRTAYQKKGETEFIQNLYEQFGDFYLIPEGGTNNFAIKGCVEFAQSLTQINFDYLCLPVGTGGTMAGMIAGLQDKKEIIGFPVLKGGEFLKQEIETLLEFFPDHCYKNWILDPSYHHGGYAKTTKELLSFIADMRAQYNLPLDPVYTGKLLWGVFNYLKKNKFKKGSTVLVLHTGGLQNTI